MSTPRLTNLWSDLGQGDVAGLVRPRQHELRERFPARLAGDERRLPLTGMILHPLENRVVDGLLRCAGAEHFGRAEANEGTKSRFRAVGVTEGALDLLIQAMRRCGPKSRGQRAASVFLPLRRGFEDAILDHASSPWAKSVGGVARSAISRFRELVKEAEPRINLARIALR